MLVLTFLICFLIAAIYLSYAILYATRRIALALEKIASLEEVKSFYKKREDKD